MKTGATSERLERAATALRVSSVAVNYGNHVTFVVNLSTALHLITEVLLGSEMLDEDTREDLLTTYSDRLRGIDAEEED